MTPFAHVPSGPRSRLVAALLLFGCGPSVPPARPNRDSANDPGGPDGAAQTRQHRHHGGHHRFDNAEEWATQFDDPARDVWQRPDDVVTWIGLAPGATVADLGAGTGYFAVRFARVVPDGLVLANDVEPDMVRYLGARAKREGLSNLEPVQGRPDDPNLDRQIDVAFMCDVYHHIADRKTFFLRVRERLLDGGRLVVVDFRKDAPEDAPGPPSAMRVSADAVIRELAPLGFELSRRDAELLPYQYVLEFTLARGSGASDELPIAD